MTYIEPYLRRKVSQEKFVGSWTSIAILFILAGLTFAAEIYFTQVREILPTAHAQELPTMTDKQIYESFDGETKILCTKYLQEHD